MKLADAEYLAKAIISELSFYCDRIEVAGSVRRKQPVCTDIDIVCVPKREPILDMFNNVIGQEVSPAFIKTINQWTKVKGDPTGKYTQRIVDGQKIEISMCNPDNWGNIFLIRTGDSEFSHMLMKRCLKLGFQQRDGYLWDEAGAIPLFEEIEYFNTLNLPYVSPEKRNRNAFRRMPAR